MPEAARYNAADYRDGSDREKRSSGQGMRKSHKESEHNWEHRRHTIERDRDRDRDGDREMDHTTYRQ